MSYNAKPRQPHPKRCWTCNETKSFEDFESMFAHACNECRDTGKAKWTKAKQRTARYRADTIKYLQQNKRWKEANALRYRSQQSEYRRARIAKRRKEVMDYYGNRCACCGEAEPMFMTIDHVNGGGNDHRREVGPGIWEWVLAHGFPEGFELRCYNCNMGKQRNGGLCPHEAAAEAVGEPDSRIRG